MALTVQNGETSPIQEVITYDKVHMTKLNIEIPKTNEAPPRLHLEFCLYGINSVGDKVFQNKLHNHIIDNVDEFIALKAEAQDILPYNYFIQLKELISYLITDIGLFGVATLQ